MGLPRGVLVLLGLALGFGVLLGLNQLRDYVAPVLLAMNLVIAAWPLQTWLRRVGLPGWLATTVTGSAVFAFLVAFFASIGWSIAQLIAELPQYRGQFQDLYAQLLDLLARFGVEEAQLTSELAKLIDPQAIVNTLAGFMSNVTGAAGLLVTTVIVLLFLLMDSLTAGRRAQLIREEHPSLYGALLAFSSGVRRYWVVTTIFGLLVAVLDVLALVFLGVPLAVAWGVLSFITNYIPNVGFVIGLVPPALIALLANGPMNALLVVIAYSVINFLLQSIVQPRFTGDAVGVNVTMAFISLIVWAWVLGPIGALLALPCTLLVKALLVDADPQARWVNAFIAANPESARAPSAAEAIRPGSPS